MLKRSWLLILVLMTSVVLFTGCFGSDDPEEEPVPVEDANNEGMGDQQFDNQQADMENQLAQEMQEGPLPNEAGEMPMEGGEQQQAIDNANVATIDVAPCYFAFDDFSLNETAKENLRAKAQFLTANAAVKIVVEGHCDERGSNQYNLALGERRAHSVKMFLENQGVSPERISIISYGEEKPIDPGHSEEAWQKNRRTEFVQQ